MHQMQAEASEWSMDLKHVGGGAETSPQMLDSLAGEETTNSSPEIAGGGGPRHLSPLVSP